MKKIIIVGIVLLLISGCTNTTEVTKKSYAGTYIYLNGTSATIEGNRVDEYDYTWHIDANSIHDDVNDAPCEYYTGTIPDDNLDVYIDHNLEYYPYLDEDKFILTNYDGEKEYVYYYNGDNSDYIFSTLPGFRSGLPTYMMHTEQEANNNAVLHINKAGTYILEGSWNGQIYINLGDKDDVYNDENEKVTLILNGVDVTCSVAPCIIFENLYESDNSWEDKEDKTYYTDLSNAGANIIIADDTENNISGCNIYRMLKTKYKDEETKVQKKIRKIDAPLYSYVSLSVDGEEKSNGKLNITSSFEGLDSELHMAINGGDIHIKSQDDGINVNEDNVSTLIINDGTVTLDAGLGDEGDGIDSNGYVVINGGSLSINNIEVPDNYIDTEDGIYYFGGEVYIDNKLFDIQQGQSVKEIGNERQGPGFGFRRNSFEERDFNLEEIKKKIAELDDTATYQDVLEIIGIDEGIPQGEFGEKRFGVPPVDLRDNQKQEPFNK